MKGVREISHLIFICTGNTCRSVMAEALFNHYKHHKKSLSQCTATSAGIAAFPGTPASAAVRELLKIEEGIDLSEHSATLFTTEMAQKADLLLVMSESHKEAILKMHPGFRKKTKLLKEFISPEYNYYDISDPFGGDLEIYRETLQEIKGLILKLIEKL